MKKQGVDYQLVLAGQHCCNAAKHAIQTFKNHFIMGLCTTDKNFPLHLWDCLVQHSVLTLNLLWGSWINPKLSAWAQVYGHYDFNRTPIAPPGIKVLVHKKPSNRNTWASHAIEGWYVGPALLAYQCYCMCIMETKCKQIADTLTWFPTTAPMPTISSQDIIASATWDILHALQNLTNSSPIAPTTDTETEILKQLTTILHNKTTEDAEMIPKP